MEQLQQRQAANAIRYQQLMVEAVKQSNFKDALYFAEKGVQVDPSNTVLCDFMKVLQEKALLDEEDSDDDSEDDSEEEDTDEAADSNGSGEDSTESSSVSHEGDEASDEAVHRSHNAVDGSDVQQGSSELIEGASKDRPEESFATPDHSGYAAHVESQRPQPPLRLKLDPSNNQLSSEMRRKMKNRLMQDIMQLKTLQSVSAVITSDPLLS